MVEHEKVTQKLANSPVSVFNRTLVTNFEYNGVTGRLSAISQDNLLYIWDIKQGKLAQTLTGIICCKN